MQVKGPGGSGTLSGAASRRRPGKHSCAVKSDGTVWCWGRNDKGQSGNNTTTDALTPVQVKGSSGSGTLSGAVGVAAGQKPCVCGEVGRVGVVLGAQRQRPARQQHHGEQLVPGAGERPGRQRHAGRWSGSSAAGAPVLVCRPSPTTRCGAGGATTRVSSVTTPPLTGSSPVQVKGGGWTGVFGEAVALARRLWSQLRTKVDGSVWCWGRNDKGQLGDDTTSDSLVPVQVKASGGVGHAVRCGVGHGGAEVCMRSDIGRHGVVLGRERRRGARNNTTSNSSAPVQVKGPGGTGTLTGVVGVAAGETSVCAAKGDGTVWCWGRNDKGQLGDTRRAGSAPCR